MEKHEQPMGYPTSEQYPAVYRDPRGEERTVIENDGRHLRMAVRGVAFVGRTLDDFEPLEGTPEDALAAFTLNHVSGTRGTRLELCGCEIEYEAPVSMMVRGRPADEKATLRVRLLLGKPSERGMIDRQELRLELSFGGGTYPSGGVRSHDLFESGLVDIQASLPDGVSMRACFTCAFSDYSPAGQGCFGTLACFRGNKAEYREVRDKYRLLDIWDSHTERVQETYRCPEWERRAQGAGYRG